MKELVIVDDIALEGCEGITKRRADFDTFLENTNGCGAGDAIIDFVPDTIYGLDIAPICNLHDDGFVFCDPTYDAFKEQNEMFYSNLKRWIEVKSNWFMQWPRKVRAYWYYRAVSSGLGWNAFAECKNVLGSNI